jgi:hypothetical protein
LLLALPVIQALAAGAAEAAVCLPRERLYQFQLNATDNNQHTRGFHESYTRFNYYCECDLSCRSTCTPNLSDSRCLERGRLSEAGIHRPLTRSRVVGGSKSNAFTEGASCGSGFGCFIQFCPAGVCSRVGISGGAQPLDVGIKVTFTTSLPTVWDGQLDWPFECDACETRASLPQGSGYLEQVCTGDCGSDGGGGGGGSGGGGWCYFNCRSITLSGGTAYEVCTLNCY